MIYEFYDTEDKHGKSSVAMDVNFGGRGRKFVFCNDPKNQRICNCQKCGTKIPREVPRIRLAASYYHGAGYYCLSCGIRKLENKQVHLKDAVSTITDEIKNLDVLLDISEKVMQNKFYEDKMSLARLCQVVAGEDSK